MSVGISHIRLRPMTAIYLTRGESILLLYRIGSRIVGNSYTGTAGGHMEAAEICEPERCVLRELLEETGLSEDAIFDLTLKYITMRNKDGEIRQNYYYFAKLRDDIEITDSNEGRLEWHKISQIADLPMPVTARHVIDHYVKKGRYDQKLYGGITTETGTMFAELRDF